MTHYNDTSGLVNPSPDSPDGPGGSGARAGAEAFQLLPAIDLRAGRVVRLREGDAARETVYGDDPVAVALAFADAGGTWLHVVDLDGAFSGRPVQTPIIDRIVAAVGDRMRCQVAGGLRTDAAVAIALASGAARVVVGTSALRDPAFATSLVRRHGSERIVVALDVRDGLALGEGWRTGGPGLPVLDALDRLADTGVSVFAATAIARDGLLGGPDLELLSQLVAARRGDILASGGVTNLTDLHAVRALGCRGAIVGRALYEGELDLREAVRAMA